MNSRHPHPRRMWKVGPGAHFPDQFRTHPRASASIRKKTPRRQYLTTLTVNLTHFLGNGHRINLFFAKRTQLKPGMLKTRYAKNTYGPKCQNTHGPKLWLLDTWAWAHGLGPGPGPGRRRGSVGTRGGEGERLKK